MKDSPVEFREGQLALFHLEPWRGTPPALTVGAAFVQFVPELAGQSSIFPVPDDVPADFPRLVLQGKRGALSCIFTGQRTDLKFVALPNAAFDFKLLADSSFGLIKALEHLAMRVSRIGFVVQGSVPVEDGIQFLRKNYVTGGAFEQQDAIELSVLRSLDVGGSGVNRWLRLFGGGEIPRSEIRFMVDLNTKPGQDGGITGERCTALFEAFVRFVQQPANQLIDLV
ncbi:MAG: hypothetical protein ACYC53_10620 [Bacillota bacterium]